MELLYAITLIVALAAAAAAILSSVIGLVKPSLFWHRLTWSALALGSFSLVTSVVVHSQWGHGPGTVAPMNLRRLLSEHEAFPTVGGMLLLAVVLDVYRWRRQRGAAVRHRQANQ